MSKSFLTDEKTPIIYFKNKVEQFITQREWKKYHTPKNLIQALQIEVSELSELFLFKEYLKEDILINEELYESVCNEVADIFIYLISFVNSLNIDLTNAFINKMKINEKKYPIDEFNGGIYYKKDSQ
ncbi:MAG: nucleotide pyrophosphohydrolase [Promethearchaeota archaeon]